MKSHFILLVAALTGVQIASAATIIASSDSPGRTSGSVTPTTANTARLGVGPVSGSSDSYRTYLTFNLTSAQLATTVSLTLFDGGNNEANTTVGSNGQTLDQTFTLFQVASNWDGVTPMPLGTNLATWTTTGLGSNPSGDLTFSSTALTSAFNAAVGGTLYLGIYSPQGEAAAATTRGFKTFRPTDVGGSEYLAGEEPTLTYTPVPEPSAALLGGLGMLALLRRRR